MDLNSATPKIFCRGEPVARPMVAFHGKTRVLPKVKYVGALSIISFMF
jgi:hypothetical protein